MSIHPSRDLWLPHWFEPVPNTADFADRLRCKRCGRHDWPVLPQDDNHRNIPRDNEGPKTPREAA